MAVQKRTLVEIQERIDSALARLSRIRHPFVQEVVQMDLMVLKERIDYAIEVCD